MTRAEVTTRLVVRHRTARITSHRQGTATTNPSTQWTVAEVWGRPTSRATPAATASREITRGPDRNSQCGLMSTRTFSPGSSSSR
jgi:hypothetical protein